MDATVSPQELTRVQPGSKSWVIMMRIGRAALGKPKLEISMVSMAAPPPGTEDTAMDAATAITSAYA